MADNYSHQSTRQSEKGFALVAFAIILPIFVLLIFMSFQLGKQTAELSVIPMRLDALFSSGLPVSYEIEPDGFHPSSTVSPQVGIDHALAQVETFIGIDTFRAKATVFTVECQSANAPVELATSERDTGLPGGYHDASYSSQCRTMVDAMSAEQCPLNSTIICLAAEVVIPTALGERNYTIFHTYRQGGECDSFTTSADDYIGLTTPTIPTTGTSSSTLSSSSSSSSSLSSSPSSSSSSSSSSTSSSPSSSSI